VSTEEDGVDQQRHHLEELRASTPVLVEGMHLVVGSKEPLWHRPEECEHAEVLLGDPAVVRRVDESATAIGCVDDVAAPQVAVAERGRYPVEEIVQSGERSLKVARELGLPGELTYASGVEAGRRRGGTGGVGVDTAVPDP